MGRLGGGGQAVLGGGDPDVQAEPLALGRDVHVGRAVGRAGPGRGEDADAAVAERAQVLQGEGDAAPVVEDDLTGGAGQGVADRDHRQRLAQLGPEGRRGVDRLHDHAVDALVAELLGEDPLAGGIADGVQDERVAVLLAQAAADADGERLLPEVLQRAAEQTDHAGAAAGQRSGDGVGLVTQLGRRRADPLHRLLGDLQATQRVGDGGR